MPLYLKQPNFDIICARKKLTSLMLSRKLRISRSYVSMLRRYKKYKVAPSGQLRNKIIKLLDTDFDTIFFHKP